MVAPVFHGPNRKTGEETDNWHLAIAGDVGRLMSGPNVDPEEYVINVDSFHLSAPKKVPPYTRQKVPPVVVEAPQPQFDCKNSVSRLRRASTTTGGLFCRV